MSAEYILAGGNPNVILCERGIRTFETFTRNTPGPVRRAGRQDPLPSASGGGPLPRLRQGLDGGAQWPWRRWPPGPTAS